MSAGIGSELRSLRQYRKLVGSSVEVLLTSGIKLLARLDEVTDEGITLSYEEKQAVEGKKRKQLVKVSRTYPFSEITYTKVWLEFKSRGGVRAEREKRRRKEKKKEKREKQARRGIASAEAV